MHSRGIQGAGGVGKYLTELIIDGYPKLTSLWNCDIQRFVPHHSNKKFLRDRVKETIGSNRTCMCLFYNNLSFNIYFFKSVIFSIIFVDWLCLSAMALLEFFPSKISCYQACELCSQISTVLTSKFISWLDQMIQWCYCCFYDFIHRTIVLLWILYITW